MIPLSFDEAKGVLEALKSDTRKHGAMISAFPVLRAADLKFAMPSLISLTATVFGVLMMSCSVVG